MKGLKSLLSPSPNKNLDKPTLLDLYKNRVKVVENQTHNLQAALCEYVRSDGFCVELSEQVTEFLDKCILWSSQIRDLYQSSGAYRRSQGCKLFDNLQQFTHSSDIDIYTFLKRFQISTFEFDFPEERAELLYNKFLSSSIQEEIIRYRNDYESMKSFLIQRYGDPRILIPKMIEPLKEEIIPDKLSDVQAYLSYYRKLQSIMLNIQSYLDPQTGYQDYFESYIFSQDFLHTLLVLIPLDAKLEFFKAMQMNNEDTLWIKGEIAFKHLLSAVCDFYELHYRMSLFQPISGVVVDEGIESSCADDVCNGLTNGKGDAVSCHRETKRNTLLVRPVHSISGFKHPCILPGHNHSIAKCTKFFGVTSADRVEARKISKIKHCAICLQSSNSCGGGKCSNISSVPEDLLCHDCKQINMIQKKRPCYSVLFCSSQSHRKPAGLDIYKALSTYIPGFQVGMTQLTECTRNL